MFLCKLFTFPQANLNLRLVRDCIRSPDLDLLTSALDPFDLINTPEDSDVVVYESGD